MSIGSCSLTNLLILGGKHYCLLPHIFHFVISGCQGQLLGCANSSIAQGHMFLRALNF